MKQLFLVVAIVVCCVSSILAQTGFPCDMATGGLELRNAAGTSVITSMPADGTAIIRWVLRNEGTDPSCGYMPGQAQAVLYFHPTSSVNNVCRYNGPASFTAGKFTFTWNPTENSLEGVNNQVFSPGLANSQIVSIPVAGVKVGTASFLYQLQSNGGPSDDINNNSGFISIVVAAPLVVLPVTIDAIDGLADKCNAQLKWSTSNETNLKRFEIETSKDGIKFEKAGSVSPTAAYAGKYQFNTNQGTGNAYYRLKIVDQDGSFSYSKIINISTACNDKVIRVFPNPVRLSEKLNVNISGYDASVKADLYSAAGQLVKSYTLKNGTNPLSVENLAQGFYTLKVSDNGSVTETFKINVLK